MLGNTVNILISCFKMEIVISDSDVCIVRFEVAFLQIKIVRLLRSWMLKLQHAVRMCDLCSHLHFIFSFPNIRFICSAL